MDNKIKNGLGVVGIISIALITLAVWSWVGFIGRSTNAAATFNISGTGKIVSIPDVANISFAINTEGNKDIAAIQKENTKKMNEAIALLKENGIEAKDIETAQYNINPRYQSYNCERPRVSGPVSSEIAYIAPTVCPPPSIIGYTISQRVEVKIRDFNKIGAIISGVTEKGANSISDLNFTSDDLIKLQNEARAKAIENAKEQAKTMAKAGGFKLGRLISVNENYYPALQRDQNSVALSKGNGIEAAPVPTIEPGSQNIVSSVVLTYEIK